MKFTAFITSILLSSSLFATSLPYRYDSTTKVAEDNLVISTGVTLSVSATGTFTIATGAAATINGNDISDLSSFGSSLIDDASSSGARTTLGLDSVDFVNLQLEGSWETTGAHTVTGAFTSPGIDDNATGTILTIGDSIATFADGVRIEDADVGGATRLFLTSDSASNLAPEIWYEGYRQTWISGIDVANNGGGADFVPLALWNPVAESVTDLIYVTRGKTGDNSTSDESGFPAISFFTGGIIGTPGTQIYMGARPTGTGAARHGVGIRANATQEGSPGTYYPFYFYDSGGTPTRWMRADWHWNQLDVAGTTALDGQTTLTSQAASTDNAAMTRQLTEEWVGSDSIVLREYFLSGGNTSGTLGQLGWFVYGSGQAYTLNNYATGGVTLSPPAITSSLPCTGVYLGSKTAGGGAGYPAICRLTSGRAEKTTVTARVASGAYSAANVAWSCGLAYSQNIGERIIPPKGLGMAWIPSGGTWDQTTAYVVGDVVYPTTPDGFGYICTTAGTSGGTEPSWSGTYATTASDNTAIWTNSGIRGSATGKILFFVSGADPNVNITTQESTVAFSGTSTAYSLTVTFDATNAYFAVNGETPISIAWSGVDLYSPYFTTRNDKNSTASTGASALIVMQQFALTCRDRTP